MENKLFSKLNRDWKRVPKGLVYQGDGSETGGIEVVLCDSESKTRDFEATVEEMVFVCWGFEMFIRTYIFYFVLKRLLWIIIFERFWFLRDSQPLITLFLITFASPMFRITICFFAVNWNASPMIYPSSLPLCLTSSK